MAVIRGQVWQLGKHRLMCGDATVAADMARLMDGKKATLCFADPPYGMKKENDGVLNDNLNYDDLLDFNRQWIPLSLDALTDIGSWYCWGQDEPLMNIYAFILRPMKKTRPLTFRNLIVWNKSYLKNGGTFNPFGASGSSGLRSYPVADEKCLFVMLGRQVMSTNSDAYWEGWEPLRAYLDGEREKMGWDSKDIKRITGVGMFCHWFTRSQWTLPTRQRYEMLRREANGRAFTRDYEELKRDYDELKRDYDELKRDYDERCRSYFVNADKSNNVWNIERTPIEEKNHPTAKSYEVCARAIKSSSREGDIVLDPFAGGGSTLIACERLNRTCYTMELSPDWCEVILKRYEDETGDKPVLLF